MNTVVVNEFSKLVKFIQEQLNDALLDNEKKEINKLIGRINQEGLTLVPTKMYFKKGKVKIEIAVAKGKKLYDKRQSIKKRDWNREKAKLMRNNKR